MRSWGGVDVDNVKVVERADTCQFAPADPLQFERFSGQPVTTSASFDSCGGAGTMIVETTGVASAVVMLNGETVVDPSALDGRAGVLELPIHLRSGENGVSVQLRGKPGTRLSVRFDGE